MRRRLRPALVLCLVRALHHGLSPVPVPRAALDVAVRAALGFSLGTAVPVARPVAAATIAVARTLHHGLPPVPVTVAPFDVAVGTALRAARRALRVDCRRLRENGCRIEKKRRCFHVCPSPGNPRMWRAHPGNWTRHAFLEGSRASRDDVAVPRSSVCPSRLVRTGTSACQACQSRSRSSDPFGFRRAATCSRLSPQSAMRGSPTHRPDRLLLSDAGRNQGGIAALPARSAPGAGNVRAGESASDPQGER